MGGLNMNTTAMYLRLSDDDTDINTTKTESNSISGQRIIVRNFINSIPELKNTEIKEYCDDGYSGVNFNRPSVTKLLADIKSSLIKCIVVKDLSRFGRNFVEVGDYLEQIFPVLGIRFIAVNDNYDSNNNGNYSTNMEVAFRNLMNEEYSRDISNKVKAVKELHKKQGLFLDGIAPYGYKVVNKQLVIDEYAANIVKQIFKLAEMGVSFINIAKALNDENITPRGIYSGNVKNVVYWKPKMVSNILHNQIYTGTLINNKQTSTSPRVMKNNATDNWLVFENHHEPIINNDIFENVQKRFHKFTAKKYNNSYYNEFKKKVYCKGCGQLLQRHYIANDYALKKAVKSFYFKCDYAITESCCSDRVYIETLNEVVTNSLKTYIEMIKGNISNINAKYSIVQQQADRALKSITDEIKTLEDKILVEYTNYRSNSISKAEFVSRREKISDKIFVLNIEREKLEKEIQPNEVLTQTENLITEYKDNTIPDAELINRLVKKIYISSANEIEIEWNFEDVSNIEE
jgi:DNA invertase Pin-like site-specific DNA recombinase/uncharacterized protein (DUF2344 family)